MWQQPSLPNKQRPVSKAPRCVIISCGSIDLPMVQLVSVVMQLASRLTTETSGIACAVADTARSASSESVETPSII